MSNLKCHCLKKESICSTAKFLQATTRPPLHNRSRIQGHQAEQWRLSYTQGPDRFSCLDSIVQGKRFLPDSDWLLLPHRLQAKQLQQFTYSAFANPFDFLWRELGQLTPTALCMQSDFHQKAEINSQLHLLTDWELKEDTHPQLDKKETKTEPSFPVSRHFLERRCNQHHLAQAVNLHENLLSLNILKLRDGGTQKTGKSASPPTLHTWVALKTRKTSIHFQHVGQCIEPHLTWLFLLSLLSAPWSCRGQDGHQNLHRHLFLCRCASACSAQSHVSSVFVWLLKYGSVCV